MEKILELRKEIDSINSSLVSLLAKHFDICREIINEKLKFDIPSEFAVCLIESRSMLLVN